jgi:hypothetical protein
MPPNPTINVAITPALPSLIMVVLSCDCVWSGSETIAARSTDGP